MDGSSNSLLFTIALFDIVCDVRLVFDTDVVVAALRSPSGGSAALLRAIRLGQGALLMTPTLLLEYEAVCLAAWHRIRHRGCPWRKSGRVLDALTLIAEPVTTYFRWRPQLRDPGRRDGPGGSRQWRSTCTRDVQPPGLRAGTRAVRIEILSPGEALRRVRA